MTNSEESKKRSHWPISILSSFASVVNLVMPLVLVRYLTAEEVGLFKIFFLYLMMVPAFSMASGFLDGVAYWSGQEERRRRVALQMSSLMMFSVGLLFALLAIVLHEPVSAFLGWPELHTILFGVSLFGAIAGTYLEESVIAQGRVWLGAFFYSGFEMLRAFLIVAAVIYEPTVLTVFVVHAALSFLKTLISIVIGLRLGLVGFEWDNRVFGEAVRYAMPVSLAWVFGIFVSHTDQFILSFYILPNAFAYYTIGCLAIPPLYIIEHSICRVMIPQLSEAFRSDRLQRAARLYREASENIAFLIIPAVAGLFVFADPIIELFFTSAYASAADYLRLFAFSYLSLCIPFDAVARAKGISGWLFKSFVFFSIFSLSLTTALVIPFSTFGALSALLIIRLCMRIYALVYMHQSVGWGLREMLPLFPLFQFTFVSVALSLLSISTRPMFADDRLWFLVAGALFAALYFLILGLWKVRRYTEEAPGERILMLLPSFEIGGMERMVLQLSETLVQRGQRVFAFAYDAPIDKKGINLSAEFVAAGVTVEAYSRSNQKRFSPAAVWKIIRFINAHDIQVIHSHNLGSLMHAVLARFISLHPVCIIHTQHSFVHLSDKSRYALYEKIFTRFADKVICVSEATFQQYAHLGLPEKRLAVIPNGVTFRGESVPTEHSKHDARSELLGSELLPEAIRKRLESLSDDTWILNLARIDSIKGQRNILKVWSNLTAETRQSSVLLFVGPEAEKDFLKNFLQEVNQAPDADRIVYCGPSSSPSVWYSASDLYVSGSTFEGMPLAPLESLAHGLPCVLSDIPGHKFLEGDVALFSLEAPKSGAHKIEESLRRCKEQGYFTSMGTVASRIRSEHGVSRMAERYDAVFQNACRLRFSQVRAWRGV